MGNGSCSWLRRGFSTVHPHAYGERAAAWRAGTCQDGSSPRIWGTGTGALDFVQVSRFIPTHMGNGGIARALRMTRAVHPHAYGERSNASCSANGIRGSSPRIWGTEAAHPTTQSPRRFIPTHMGNGSLGTPKYMFIAVHPHAYGERGDIPIQGLGIDGSSPRIWGTDDAGPSKPRL